MSMNDFRTDDTVCLRHLRHTSACSLQSGPGALRDATPALVQRQACHGTFSHSRVTAATQRSGIRQYLVPSRRPAVLRLLRARSSIGQVLGSCLHQ